MPAPTTAMHFSLSYIMPGASIPMQPFALTLHYEFAALLAEERTGRETVLRSQITESLQGKRAEKARRGGLGNRNHARAAGWLQKAANSRPGFEAQTQNKETIPYTQPADGNPRPRLLLGQSKAGPSCPSATSRVVPTAHQHSCVSTKAAEVRTERAPTSPENLPPGSPCYGPESSSQPAVITSHRMFSSMVISTTSVRAVQDGSCL
ncbi:uncharacterized protein LOC128078596 [Tympanuchus pallidicinctus]|uniref:uncharacterized protein LOC128078596 n=1 Tax=Tympanuchus pallidicinctus TaxID=109042 RepID=UPI002286D4C5|nr:uncharacterized protein LOC128078596 [Tympanuchus pallidicinctus]